jgi:FtsP/CotA-like multicopper oxidase with cupredoxin domain
MTCSKLFMAVAMALSSLACGDPMSKPFAMDPRPRPWDGISPPAAMDLDPNVGVVHVELDAAQLPGAVAGATSPMLGYSGISPGPTIRARIGDRVIVDFRNRMQSPTTVHWHGLHVPFEMDGAHWMHLGGIPAAGAFRFEFQVNQAGTFWYHPHFDSQHQVDAGLFGAIVVEDPKDPTVDADVVLVLDIWKEGAAAGTHGTGGTAGNTDGHVAQDWRVNNLRQPTLTIKGGRTIRLRMINVSNHGYLHMRWPDMRKIAGDQGILAEEARPETVLLAPGDRSEFEWRTGETDFAVETLPYSLNGGPSAGINGELLFVQVVDPTSAPPPSAWPFSGAKPSGDAATPDIVYVLQGDTTTDKWFINGEQFPRVTIETAPLGATRIVEVRNLSPTEHPFHVHGHAVEVLSLDGKTVAAFTWEDTINIPIHSAVRLKLRADNPGDWMTHCHILEHADGGMMTVLRVQQ